MGFSNKNYYSPEEHKELAREIRDSSLAFLNQHLSGTNAAKQPVRQSYAGALRTPKTTTPNASTPQKRAVPLATARKPKDPVVPEARPTTVKHAQTTSPGGNVDLRIYTQAEAGTLLTRDQPFLIREATVKAIPQIAARDILRLWATSTGWAVKPNTKAAYDLILQEANIAKICKATRCTSLERVEKWYTYRLAFVPNVFRGLMENQLVTSTTVAKEAEIQIGIKPVNCHSAYVTDITTVWFTELIALFPLDALGAMAPSLLATKTVLPPQKRPGRSGEDRATAQANGLKIAWANVGKSGPVHMAMLQLAFEEGADVVCIQESSVYSGTRTQNHPVYKCYASVDVWEHVEAVEREAERPRAMSYTRRAAELATQQRRNGNDRDLVWLEVNGYHIVNIYREPNILQMIDYVTSLQILSNFLIGRDFNAKHDMFEPGIVGADYIGEPGEPTHRAGYTIDLTFSNIPFAETKVRHDLDCGSDHYTQITLIPARGLGAEGNAGYRVSDANLPRLAHLIDSGIPLLPRPADALDTRDLDSIAELLATLFQNAIKAVGNYSRGMAKAAHWWTPVCARAHASYTRARRLSELDHERKRREMLTAVRQAKCDYWRRVIDNAADDVDLYKVVGWHKLTPLLKALLLVVDGRSIESTKENAEVLLEKVLYRYNDLDDLDYDPLEAEGRRASLLWATEVSLEEVEKNVIGVSSISPGADCVIVRLLKACWQYIKLFLKDFFQKCLELAHFPTEWKLAEVVMLLKAGKKDKSLVRSWRPIALLSCIGKGLERLVARRISWAAIHHGVISPQHGGALPKRSAVDLAVSFVYDTESAFAQEKEVTLVILDVQGAFDALLPRRLLDRMRNQGWPLELLRLIRSFLQDRRVKVRLEGVYTAELRVQYGTPQGSPLSPVLYVLYLAELLNQDRSLRFGYADDIAIYRASKTAEENVTKLERDVRQIMQWGAENKIAFAPEKLEMIHLSRKRGLNTPSIKVSPELTIRPVEAAGNEQSALRWLGIWLDRKLTFKHHVVERTTKATKVARHIKGLAGVKFGPPAASLRKAVITYIQSSLLYGLEATDTGPDTPSGATARGSGPALATSDETAACGQADPTSPEADGSEQYRDGAKLVGYGYAVYKGQALVKTGSSAINSTSHVFDAEAIGALKGLQSAIEIPRPATAQLWMCIDSTSVIWCMRANASNTSQWAFLECHELMDRHKVGIRWSPGHMNITGNEKADELANVGANAGRMDNDRSAEPTISGIGSTARALACDATTAWWIQQEANLSAAYRKWRPSYAIRDPPELQLPRATLHRLLAIRTTHSDFAKYHRRFGHDDAELDCHCGYAKTPEHLVFCEISQRKFHAWPAKPDRPPSCTEEGRKYLSTLISQPKLFENFLAVTQYFQINAR
ncbi:hypothetical protein DSL72_002926 [Monilinia vaccinii-corymbosi]|uniref:Reverse transcriptase domain-containing protein n=1 Tax=Monilinia vaccinii-corymbosi TaxID=61207 RepID=A0A8A3PDY6_9HELO|nr:hypothetical protein DSL72_002926 [Monilinia vaccinii-corymbosi]